MSGSNGNGHKPSSNGHKTTKKAARSRHKVPKKLREPTDLQKAFAAIYVEHETRGKVNASQVARESGYRGSNATIARMAHDTLKSPQVQKLIKELRAKTDQMAPLTQFTRIMGGAETLARTTFLAAGSMEMLLTDGKFDFAKAEKLGALYLLKRLKIRETTRTFRDGSVEETIVYDATLRDKIGSLHDLGLHHDLWNAEIDDPDGILARILSLPKAQIPASLEPDPNVGAIDAEEVKEDEVDPEVEEVSDKSQ